MLNGLPLPDYSAVSPAWFEQVTTVAVGHDDAFVGPLAEAAGEFSGATGSGGVAAAGGGDQWIVRLTEPATRLAGTVRETERLLDAPGVDFQVIRGLGLPGQVLVRSTLSLQEAETQFACNPRVAHFERDVTVYSQVTPNDPEFSSLTGLHNVGQFGATGDADIDAPEAWSINTGSPSVVVGVVDSGVDLTHPDLYANIWINQGEVPAAIAAVKGQIDRDHDDLITFNDLNDPANAAHVRDFNANGYIDADDLLRDIRWADRFDTDQNGFVDDLFGWDFRQAAEGYIARNLPSDANGHGTHVAGTIGAMGNNGEGVVGVNWQTSLMVLKVLDESNSGFTSDAVQAINYATMMRTRSGAPVNVRVLNNSWGQSGAYSPSLQAAIQTAGEAEILLVAAAGNGNILGQGLDNDQFPFYPASYELDNVISVAASDRSDRLAGFSNYGVTSVDIAAPGVGVLSTLPDGKYGSLQGTSMAAPHVSGVAALVWSHVPWATVGEVREAILSTAQRGDPGNPNDPLHALTGKLSSAGRLRADAALTAEVFAPLPELVSAANIVNQGTTPQTMTVRYTDAVGLDVSTLDASDLVVWRLWGPNETLAVSFVSVAPPAIGPSGERIYEATYELNAPGGTWDAADYGPYEIVLQADQVKNTLGLAASPRVLGRFLVRIDDPAVIYVNSFADAPDANVGDGIVDDGTGRRTLRAAIQEANAAGTPRTIILESGTYKLAVAGTDEDAAATGDLDVTGNVTILGARAETTVIDAAAIDRVFDVRPGGSLSLARLAVTGGNTSGAGGGINNAQALRVTDTWIVQNTAERGGGVFSGAGSTLSIVRGLISRNVATNYGNGLSIVQATSDVDQTTISENNSPFPPTGSNRAGIFIEGGSTIISRSTIANNLYGNAGIFIDQGASVEMTNSTVSGNLGLSMGGGIYQRSGTTTLTNVTMVDNRGYNWGGIYSLGLIRLRNCLIAGNFGKDEDVYGSVESLGHNLIGRGRDHDFDQPGDRLGLEIRKFLGPLADNGGPTATHALLPGSPAIDSGDSDNVAATDQRGKDRKTDGDGRAVDQVDVGAFELQEATIRGVVFADLDGDRARDANEPGLAGRVLFVDANQNGEFDPGEPTATTQEDDPNTAAVTETGRYEFLDVSPGVHQIAQLPGGNWRQTAAGRSAIELVDRASDGTISDGRVVGSFGSRATISISADGRFVAFPSLGTNLAPNDTGYSDVFVYDRQNNAIERVSIATAGAVSSGGSDQPSISAEGRFVAFESDDGNLVPDDTNAVADIFLRDREIGSTIRISLDSQGGEANGSSFLPSISADGCRIAFGSYADNLVPDDSGLYRDVFLYDCRDQSVRRLSVGSNGEEGNAASLGNVAYINLRAPAISADGNTVVFVSSASNLVPDDTNGRDDLFAYDVPSGRIERISWGRNGTEVNQDIFDVSISADGRFVAFASAADNIVAGDTNGSTDVFVCDRETGFVDRVSTAFDGSQANVGASSTPSISADGRYVVFVSFASNLVPGDTNGIADTFVFDRQKRRIERLSVATDGTEASGLDLTSWATAISADGRYAAFTSDSRLVPDDDNAFVNAFVRSTPANGANADGNPLSFRIDLYAGQVLSDIDFGVQAFPGEISGRHFEDLNANGLREWWEPGLSGWTAYLDLDENGTLDGNEPTAVTDAQGAYLFPNVAASQEYTVALVPQAGWTPTVPGSSDGGVWRVYVGPGARITDCDFGSRRDDATGQTGTATIEGIVFRDVEDDGTYGGNEPGVAGQRVFLDVNDNGALDYDEPYQDTSADGRYSFPNLGNRTYAVRLVGDDAYEQSFPQGNQLSKQDYAFAGPKERIERAGDVFVGDLNGDGAPDLVVARPTTDNVSIWLNDGHGNFPGPATTLQLYPDGLGPVAIAGGDFNGNKLLDLAIADQLNSKVTVLLDFQSGVENPHFASIATVAVGAEPRAITVGDLDGDLDLDLAVANEGDQSVSILRNNGTGTFTPTVGRLAAGNSPVAIIAADFDDDHDMDLAVANFGDQPKGTDRGQVSILLNQGGGSFAQRVDYVAGSGPTGLVTGDFDKDSHVDLAVSNLVSNNATLLRGKGDGTFHAGIALAAGTQPNDIAAADTDGDDDLDLIVANGGGNNVSILRNQKSQGTFGFEPPENYGVALLAGGQLPLATGDLNGDGLVDFAVAGTAHGRVTTLTNQLAAGAHRVALTGSGTVQRDFALRPINKRPTFSGLPTSLVQLNEDAPLQTVTLTDISAGRNETQDLRITTSSSNPAVIPTPTYTYISPATELTLQYGPVADRSGTAVITVTVMDAGLDGDLDTPADNAETSGSFTVTVQPLNDPPTLGPIADRPAIKEGESPAPVTLTGIGAGGGEDQQVRVQAASTNAVLIADLTVDYTWPANTATLSYTLQENASGSGVITVTVTDAGLDNVCATTGDNLSFSQSFGVTVNPVNASPTLDSIPNPAAIDEDTTQVQTVSLSGITAGTGESQRLRIVATSDKPGLIPDPVVSYTSPASTGQLTYTPLPEQNGTANITVTVIDGGPDDDPDTNDGNGSFSRVFTVTVRAVDDPPRMAAGQTFRLDEQSPKDTLVGTVQATDPDVGDTIAYTITAGNIGNAFSIDAGIGAIRVATPAALDFETTPQFNLTVQAEDRTGRKDAALVHVELNNVNEPPVANHDNVETKENLALDIAWNTLFANDSDVDSPQSQWSVASVAAEANGTASNDPANRRVRFRPDPDFRGRASFVYTLDDGQGGRDDAAVVVYVSVANASPTLDSIPNPAAIDEDTAQVQTISLAGITAGTGESQRLRVAATSDKPGLIPDPTVSFTFPSTTGQLTYQPLPEQNGTANITVTVIDGGPDDDPDTNDGNGSFSRVFTVTVRAVEDPPRMAQGLTFRLDEQSPKDTLVGTVQATDSDAGDTISYSITAGNISNALAIDAATGALRVATPAALDFETTPQFNLTFQAEDRTGRKDAAAVRIDLNNVNDAPVANHDNVETQENRALDIPWDTLFANDSDVDSPRTQWSVVTVAAEANGTAVNDPANRRIRFAPDTDFRGRASFVYTVDDGGGLRDNAAVVVRVSVANQAPTGLFLSNAVIPESIATATAALVGTLTAEDPDTGDQHVFELVAGDGDADNAVFQIVDNRLEIKAGVAVDYEAQRQYSIRVQASDGLATFQKPLTIQVTDVNEFAPLIVPQTLHVAELSVYGESVGTVVAQDGDRRQTLRFAITGGNASGAFGILPDSGEIVVTNGGQLDYETQATYTLTVTVSDSGQPLRTGTGTVIVMVDDVNEAPIFLSVRERVEGEYVGVVPVSDPDAGDSLNFTIRNDSRFEVTADGRLRLKAGASLDGKQGSVVNLQVTATDGGQPPLSRTQDFVIQVLANEHPWQNPVRANDVNARDGVQPEDVLLLINEINWRSSASGTSQLPQTRPAAALYLDPNGDDTITAADVLDVINEINRRAGGGEGEAAVVPNADWSAVGPEACDVPAPWNLHPAGATAGVSQRTRTRGAPGPNAEHFSPHDSRQQHSSGRIVAAAKKGSVSDARRDRPVPEPRSRLCFSDWDACCDWEELLQVLAVRA